MSASQSLLGCIRDHGLWLARFKEERERQVKRGRCTTLKHGRRGRLTWCQGKSSPKGGPCDHCLDESINSLHISPVHSANNQTDSAADRPIDIDPRMLWFFVGMDKADQDTRKVSEGSAE